jgi:hypothetical protein
MKRGEARNDLNDKTIIVAGAGPGLGRETDDEPSAV